jgi:hypothetical protein
VQFAGSLVIVKLALLMIVAQHLLWEDVTDRVLVETAEWTNYVELADVDGDGRVDLLFANGGNYSEPGEPEPNRVFLNRGDRFEEIRILGAPDIARVIRVRDVNGDGHVDILVGTTYQTQSRLFVGPGFDEVTESHLPRRLASVGDLEVGDVDGDGDLDIVLADWGPGNNMTNNGGLTLLWLNDGTGRFTDATSDRMPQTLVRFSWDLELVDVDNDLDLDVLVSCKRCGGGSLFRNDGSGHFEDDVRALPVYTNNYDYEPMDVTGDGFIDLITVNDGPILEGKRFHRREHILVNDGEGSFVDRTPELWPASENLGEDDNMVVFLDFDSDGDADFLLGSLTGADRLHVNDGTGHFTVKTEVFGGEPTPGTLAIAVADLNGDGKLDVVQAQGEHETAVEEKVFYGTGLAPDTAPPVIDLVAHDSGIVRARVHDRKTPVMPHDFREIVVVWASNDRESTTPMMWYGGSLFRADLPEEAAEYRVCATDAQGNRGCSEPYTRR